jgi:hypothetical protein
MEGEREAFGNHPCTKAGAIGTRHMREAALRRTAEYKVGQALDASAPSIGTRPAAERVVRQIDNVKV